MSKKWRDEQNEQLTSKRLLQVVRTLKAEEDIPQAFIAGRITWYPLSKEGALHVRFGRSSPSGERYAVLILDDFGMTLRMGEHNCTEDELSAALEKAGLVPVE